MPQVVAVVVKVVVAALVKVGVSQGIAMVVAQFAVKLAASALMSAALGALQPKPRGMEQGAQLATKVDPAYPREVAVGEFATGGSLSFENTTGSNNKHLWRIFTISDAEIEAVDAVIGNGESLLFDGDWHTGFRTCTSHFVDNNGKHRLAMRIYKGTSGQTADADLLAAFPTMLDSNFRGRGVAYALVRMEYSNEAWSGDLELIFAGRGALLYDPRTATTAYSGNLALITRQMLKGFENNGVRVVGLGVPDDDLPDADWESAADECDETVGGEPRYHGGGMINARETPRDVIAHLVAAMAGKHIDRGGEIIILPGVARTPMAAINEGDMLADVGIFYAGKRTANERFNAITSTYVEPADGYQEAPLPPRHISGAIADDGDRMETTRAYRFCCSNSHGQRLDKIELLRARKEAFISFGMPLSGFEYTPGDWFPSTSPRWGNVEKVFEIETVELAIISGKAGGTPQARALITARETSSDCYDWDPEVDLIEAGESGDLVLADGLDPILDDRDRIITVDGLPIGTLGGTGITRNPAVPLSAASSSQINVAAHDVEFVGRTYELPSATITSLSTDTVYWIFWDIEADDYIETSSVPTAESYYLSPDLYIPVGYQRTQTGGGGYTPPPPPPPGGGGGYTGGAGGVNTYLV